MNVFEDLVVELQEENLLEKDVVGGESPENNGSNDFEATDVPYKDYDLPLSDEPKEEMPDGDEDGSDSSVEAETPRPEAEETPVVEFAQATAEPAPVPAKKIKNGKEFFQKRAVAEVTSLQMVEHVLTGIEREYLKAVPDTFDDFSVKKALHAFMNVAESVNTEEHASAEFTLMQETEAWCSALEKRDSIIPVPSLRQYCENSRPALSSQAMVGLARFYRNLPYSEQVRAKFDFTITRLFSKAGERDKRVCLFSREETLDHINTFYKEWSSISLYSVDDDDSNVQLTALSFEDLAVEAESASSFDQLIATDFFGRLRLFKESISELFFAPNVTAAAIECNIRIGNAYVNLIDLERAKMNDASIHSKYGDLNDQTVSDAAARTIRLVELLRDRPHALKNISPDAIDVELEREEKREPAVAPIPTPVAANTPKRRSAVRERISFARLAEEARTINRWFLTVAILMIAASIGLYIWSDHIVGEDSALVADTVSVENSALGEHIKTARLSEGTLYCLLQPTWDTLPKEKRQEFLQKVLQAGQEKGYTKVNLIRKDGKVVGYASPNRLDVVMP